MKLRFLLAPFLVIIVILAYGGLYTVPQTQRALLLNLGKLAVDTHNQPIVVDPGLHIKWPIITSVVKFDERLQTLDIKDSLIVTKEQKDVLVNSFIKWRIQNFAEFYKATSGVLSRAEDLLEQKVSDGLRAEFGRSTIREVVSENRDEIMKSLSAQLNDSAQSLGIQVVDVRIKRIDLPDAVSSSVFERMRAAREQVAAQHRATGEKESEKIRAAGDETAAVTVARAQSTAKIMKSEADATVAKLYAASYQQDPEFYAFLESLKAYTIAFNRGDTIVLSSDNEFLRYFRQP